MLELLNVHFSFYADPLEAIAKDYPIVLRIIYRNERKDIYTGLYCDKKSWDYASGRVKSSCKQAATINKNLELINHQALNRLDELKFSTHPFTIDKLVNKLKGKEERPTLLIEYLKARNKEFELRAGVDITDATYEKYERGLRFVINFLEEEFSLTYFDCDANIFPTAIGL